MLHLIQYKVPRAIYGFLCRFLLLTSLASISVVAIVRNTHSACWISFFFNNRENAINRLLKPAIHGLKFGRIQQGPAKIRSMYGQVDCTQVDPSTRVKSACWIFYICLLSVASSNYCALPRQPMPHHCWQNTIVLREAFPYQH